MGTDGDRRRAGKAYTSLHQVADGLPRPSPGRRPVPEPTSQG